MSEQGHHETFDREQEVEGSSERSFGFVIAAFLAIVAGVRAWDGHGWIGWIIAALPFAFLAIVAPNLLRPLNRVWVKFGLLLHYIVSPIVLGFLFYLVITPVGLLMRLVGKRPLNLHFDESSPSYWIKRHPPGPDPKTMKNQF